MSSFSGSWFRFTVIYTTFKCNKIHALANSALKLYVFKAKLEPHHHNFIIPFTVGHLCKKKKHGQKCVLGGQGDL